MNKKKSAGQRARRHAARERRREQEPERRAIVAAQPTQDVVAAPHAVARAAAPETRRDERADGLDRLGRLSESLSHLHKREERLLAERDKVIDTLRELDTSWNLLATRAGLSRQALIKRRRSVGGRI